MKGEDSMELNPKQKYRWPVREQIRYLNRCLYPQLKEVDEKLARLESMQKFTDFALKSVREKLYRENNIPLSVI
jgi:hypothetical protein